MSHEVDEYYKLYNEARVCARKTHTCSACSDPIAAGHDYVRVFILSANGDIETLKRCLRCQKIHEHLRRRGVGDGMWPDEKLACGEEYEEHWGVPPPEDIAQLAFVTAEEMQRRERAA